MENEQTAAQLLEARAEADERIKDRVAFLKTRIDSDRAELAALGIKRGRVEKPKRGRPKGSRNVRVSPGDRLTFVDPNYPADKSLSEVKFTLANAATEEGL